MRCLKVTLVVSASIWGRELLCTSWYKSVAGVEKNGQLVIAFYFRCDELLM